MFSGNPSGSPLTPILHDAISLQLLERFQWSSADPLFVHVDYYLRQGGYVLPRVCLSVCLSVCLLATSRKTTERIFMKLLPQMYLRTWKKWLHFVSHPPALGILIQEFHKGFFNIAMRGILPQFGLYFREKQEAHHEMRQRTWTFLRRHRTRTTK